MKDILLVLSDQHGWAYTGFADELLDTPNLKRIAQEGCLWERCYCSSPLCVPSRMSFLTGLLPSELGIFNNDTTLPIDMPTIAHDLGTAGYETVLIGRMHFKGDDQNHGFDRRLAGDITSQYWGTGGKNRKDFGDFAGTSNRKHCLEAVGGGYSPVMAYDRHVMEEAETFLKENLERPGRPPLFIVVGFYGPHFPFVSDPERYEKYKKRLAGREESGVRPALEEYEDYLQECSREKRLHCQAAYYGLVETLDGYTGRLFDQFRSGEEKAGRENVFFYTSDHGEQLGKRGIFGKQTLYEDAVRVPLIAADSTKPGQNLIKQKPLSLLQVREMILEAAELKQEPADRSEPVYIQQILERRGELLMGEAALWFPYKAIRIGSRLRVYNLETDPWEEEDLAASRPEICRMAEELFLKPEEQKQCLDRERKQRHFHERLKAWGKAKGPKEWAVMTSPEEARRKPEE